MHSINNIMEMKNKILEILNKYDLPMDDPFYTGIDYVDFGHVADEIIELFEKEKSNGQKDNN